MKLAMSHLVRSSLTVAALTLAASLSQAADTPPTIAAALFDTPHIAELPAGTKLTYNFQRDASEPKLLGPNFKDDIGVNVDEVTDDGKRTVSIRVFSGDRGRDVRTITGLTGNPVLVFYLDRAVANFGLLAGGSTAYHKNRFRMAMGTKEGLVPAKFQYNGKTVDGYRLAIRPFTGDNRNVSKMKGYENAHFEFLMSDAVPGYFAEFTSSYSSPLKGSPSLKERIAIEGLGETTKAEAKLPGEKK